MRCKKVWECKEYQLWKTWYGLYDIPVFVIIKDCTPVFMGCGEESLGKLKELRTVFDISQVEP